MDSAADRLKFHVAVGVGRYADIYHIRIRFVVHLLKTCVSLALSGFLCELLRAAQNNIAESDKFEPLDFEQIVLMTAAHAAAADHSEFLH